VSQKVLLIEDAPDYQKIVTACLGDRFAVQCAQTAEEAIKFLANESFEIILIDVGLPGRDGLSLCQELREDPRLITTPILMVTGRNETNDVVQGFAAGADDYIHKPFKPEELRARVEARLRRAKAQNGKVSTTDRFERADLRFSVGLQRVSQVVNGSELPLELTPNEFKILYYLARSDGKTLSRVDILKEVWGENLHVIERTVDKHVCALRRKMGSAGRYVASVPGEGYRFDAAALLMPAKRA
jgi:DNA-binding response OmpR family regulator